MWPLWKVTKMYMAPDTIFWQCLSYPFTLCSLFGSECSSQKPLMFPIAWIWNFILYLFKDTLIKMNSAMWKGIKTMPCVGVIFVLGHTCLWKQVRQQVAKKSCGHFKVVHYVTHLLLRGKNILHSALQQHIAKTLQGMFVYLCSLAIYTIFQ